MTATTIERKLLGVVDRLTRPFDYRSYDRTHQIEFAGKPPLTASADPTFLGDASLHNPEDMLVAALSSCHMLSFLAICARARITVLSYTDEAEGVMVMDQPDTGRFSDVLLRPCWFGPWC